MEEVQANQEMKLDELQMVIFRLANEEYALPITKVQEINRLVPITKMPQTPSLWKESLIYEDALFLFWTCASGSNQKQEPITTILVLLSWKYLDRLLA